MGHTRRRLVVSAPGGPFGPAGLLSPGPPRPLAARPLAAWLLIAAAAALGACTRGPIRMSRGDGLGDEPPDATPPPADAPDAADPTPADRCDPRGLLPLLPRTVPGWRLAESPIYPQERFAGIPVGFVGRLFRREGLCAVVALARPDDPAAAFHALLEERPQRDTLHGRPTLTRSAPEANQVTTWILDGGERLALLRAFGTTDPRILAPFAAALLPDPDADAGAPVVSSDVGDQDCPPRNPLADVYDPQAFYGPPGNCWL